MPEVVGRDVGQALDLAHDVVAEVADDAAVERRELGDRAAPGRRASSASSAASAPRSVGHAGGRRRRRTRRGGRARPCVSAGSRPRNENRPQRSACSTDSSRKPGGRRRPAPTSFTNADTGVSRSASTSRHTGTTVWSRASARNSSRDGPDADGHARAQTGPGVAPQPKARKKQLCSPVWHAPAPSCSTTNRSASTSQS